MLALYFLKKYFYYFILICGENCLETRVCGENYSVMVKLNNSHLATLQVGLITTSSTRMFLSCSYLKMNLLGRFVGIPFVYYCFYNDMIIVDCRYLYDFILKSYIICTQFKNADSTVYIKIIQEVLNVYLLVFSEYFSHDTE